jgi:acetylornithine deacetylase/succinyl-diaminopimelate desuccinylase-like protein
MHKDISEILDRIDSQKIADLTLELVKIPSPTGQEHEAARFFASQLEKIGLEVRLDYVEPNRPNVIATLRGKGGGKNLILAGHLDTIPQEKCVPPRSETGRVYGRGACDMKGSLAAMVETARALVASNVPLRGDAILIGWVGHEAPTGKGLGPKAVAKSIREGKIKADGAVITEGPLESVGIAQGGMAIFTITTSSPKGTVHTATVPLRSNPILWMAEAVREIHAFDEELNSKPWNPLIAERPSAQLGIVTGGDFYNRLPSECRLTGTVRWDPGENVQIVEYRLKNRLDKLENRLWHSLDGDVRFKLEMDLVRESYEIPSDSEMVRSTQAAVKEVTGKDVGVSGWRGVGDPPVLNEVGVPTVFYGPFDFANMTAHSDNEWVSVESLAISSKVWTALALRYCV